MTTGFAVIAALVFGMSLVPGRGSKAVLAIGSVVVACSLLNHTFLGPHAVIPHVGVAPEAFTLTSSSLVVLAVLGLFALMGSLRLDSVLLPAIAWFALGSFAAWSLSPEQGAGIFQYLIGLAAFAVGSSSARALRNDERARATLSWVLLGVMTAQLIVVGLQIVGINLHPMSAAETAILPGRFNGMFGHPDDLGKGALIVLFLFLALRPEGSFARPSTMAAAALTVLTCAATGGRTVIVGALILLTIWGFFTPDRRGNVSRRLAISVVVLCGIAATYSILSARFAEDPTGGARSQVQAVALRAIEDQPTFGVGPNSYVTVVGQTDPLTASGVPVHNAYLLSAAEIGIAGAVCLWLPVLMLIRRAIRRRRSDAANVAVATLAFVFPLLGMTITGWGLLGSSVWALALLVAGCAYGLMERDDSRGVPLHPGHGPAA